MISGATALYDAVNTDKTLDLYDAVTGTGNLTEQYLKDRAAFLANKNRSNNQDRQQGGKGFVQYNTQPQYFEDKSGYADTVVYLGADISVVTQPLAPG